MEANAGKFAFERICRISLHFMLDPVQPWEFQNDLLLRTIDNYASYKLIPEYFKLSNYSELDSFLHKIQRITWAVLDLRNQSKRNCGALLQAILSSSYTFSLSNPSLCNMQIWVWNVKRTIGKCTEKRLELEKMVTRHSSRSSVKNNLWAETYSMLTQLKVTDESLYCRPSWA